MGTRTRRLGCFALVATMGCQSGGGDDPSVDTDGSGASVGSEGGLDDEAPKSECGGEDIAFVPIARLNRRQYGNTVRDLLYLDVDVTTDVPDDIAVGGFDNNANASSMSPAHVDAYYDLAEDLSIQAVSDSMAWSKLVPCDEGDPQCATDVASRLLERAWRRPVSDEELAPFLDVVSTARSTGASFSESLRFLIKAVLISPNFLFRMELDPEPDSPTPRALNGFELASRLSYFVWNTMPDEALFEAARDGSLMTDDGYAAQVDRMLASERAVSLVDDFATQWFGLDDVAEISPPDPETYPEFADLAPSMQTQVRLTILDYVFGRESFDNLLVDDTVVLDPALADFYGIEHPTGEGFVPVFIEDPRRRGFLTFPSFLTITSLSNRTSPVKRGQWVLSNIVCNEQPPPPADAETELPDIDEAQSLREALEQHRADPACTACHALMDEVGFAFEHYGPMGHWRETDQYGEVDASGRLLWSGVEFYGAAELSQALSEDERVYACAARKLYTYSMSRVPTEYDECGIERVASDFEGANYDFTAAIRSVVMSDAFRRRRAAPVD